MTIFTKIRETEATILYMSKPMNIIRRLGNEAIIPYMSKVIKLCEYVTGLKPPFFSEDLCKVWLWDKLINVTFDHDF